MSLPASLTLNAFTGEVAEVTGALAPNANRWGSRNSLTTQQKTLAPADEVKAADFLHPEVGWGVILPDDDTLSAADKANAVDAPEPIRRLVAARNNAPVLRYRADLKDAKLTRYFADGRAQDPEIGISDFGTGEGRLPMYLLIVGSPAQIPWSLQFSANRRHHVGRVDLPDDALSRYVDALLSDWAGMDSEPGEAVVWSANFDSITATMESSVADRIAAEMGTDNELTVRRVQGAAATSKGLYDALALHRPAVVVTSSHGKTGPLEKPDAMRASLGLPVDNDKGTLDPDALLSQWQPSGAVWYAQACCSAGSDDGTQYDGLLEKGSLAHRVVTAVGGLGAGIAPLPTRLLSAEKPLRAFVGHVEPTFDWTLVMDDTGQFLTGPLTQAWYPHLYRRKPLGLALDEHYRGVGELYGKLAKALQNVNAMVAGARDDATYYRLTATDRQSLVILGDPAVLIPPLPSQR